jgi:hypothetical protein
MQWLAIAGCIAEFEQGRKRRAADVVQGFSIRWWLFTEARE